MQICLAHKLYMLLLNDILIYQNLNFHKKYDSSIHDNTQLIHYQYFRI